MKILNHWSVTSRPTDPYQAPELWEQCLHGKVAGHERFSDGEEVTTSPIKARRGQLVLTSSGSLYKLGSIDPEYEKLYPNAIERLMGSLTETP